MTLILFSVKEVLRLPQLSVRKGQSPHAVSNGRMRHVGMALLWKTLGYLFYPAGITTWFSGVWSCEEKLYIFLSILYGSLKKEYY